MTIEDRVRRAVQFEADLVPHRLGSLPSVVSRGQRRRSLAGVAMAMLALAVVGSVWLLVNWFSAPRGGDVPPASESGADPVGAVDLGGVVVPVTGVIGTHGSGSAVYAGSVHDEPRFDTGKLGSELPFLSTDRLPIPAEVPAGEVVYVGTVSDRSIYLYEGTVVDGPAPGQLCVASTAGIAGCKSPGAQLTGDTGEAWLTGLGSEAQQ